MQLTNKPSKIVLPFANAGAKNSIPAASQIGITAGAASLTDGFPPLTRTDIAAGGIPPSGLDFNGIFFLTSAIARWAAAGAGYPYDNAFATDTNVGGYPKGSRVLRSDGLGYWLNVVENNITDPEGATSVADGWLPDFQSGNTAITMTNANVTLTPLQYGKSIIVITGTLTANVNLIFPTISESWVGVNNTTGAFAITAKTAAGTGVVLGAVTQIAGEGVNIVTQSVSNAVGIQGAFKNLQASATGTSANVLVSADEIVVENGSNAYQTLRNVSLTIAGTSVGANGLDAGTITANTWYSVWVQWNGSTTSGLLSLSTTTPTLTSGYTHKARVGWIRTDASGSKFPLSFVQAGRRVQYKLAAGSNVASLPSMASGTSAGANIATGAFVPPTASKVLVTLTGNYLGNAAFVAPNSNYGIGNTNTTAPIYLSAQTTATALSAQADILLESTNIYWYATGSSAVYANGWEDNI